jgi:hypothetical protein
MRILSRTILALAASAVLFAWMHSDSVPVVRAALSARMKMLPRQTLWAWERPEDLRAIDPATTAIAFLDQTIVIRQGKDVDPMSVPRRQPLAYPSNAKLIAVVRIIAEPGAALDHAQRSQTVALLLASAARPGIAAFQVDFDATRSQRAFYRDLLEDLRREMPAGLPLSITALASWCTNDDWLGNLPIDEAVPMLFRMEPDRRHAPPGLVERQIREPLCMGSVGISTREPWPPDLAGKRVYIFPDRGWKDDYSLVNEGEGERERQLQ